eukprot:Pgem_evm1s14960
MSVKFTCTKSPDEGAALTNAVIAAPGSIQSKYIRISTDVNPSAYFSFMVVEDSRIQPGFI